MKGGLFMEKDELLEMINHEEDQQFNKIIEHKMERKLTRKTFYKMVLFLLVIVSLIGGSQWIVKTTNYNPIKEDVEFNYILNAYVSTYYPGLNVSVLDIEEYPYGKYDVNFWVQDSFNRWISSGNHQTLKINRSTTNGLYQAGIIADNSDFERENHLLHSFENDSAYYEKQIQEIENLPDSAYINASVILKDDWTLEKMAELMNHFPNSQFAWLAIRRPTSNQSWVGINVYQYFARYITAKFPEQYSHYFDMFNLRDEPKTGEMLRAYFLEMLQVLVDHPEAYELLNNNFEERTYEKFIKEVEYYRQNQKCIGFLIYTNKHDIIELINSGKVTCIEINDVKMSKYSK